MSYSLIGPCQVFPSTFHFNPSVVTEKIHRIPTLLHYHHICKSSATQNAWTFKSCTEQFEGIEGTFIHQQQIWWSGDTILFDPLATFCVPSGQHCHQRDWRVGSFGDSARLFAKIVISIDLLVNLPVSALRTVASLHVFFFCTAGFYHRSANLNMLLELL